MPQTDLENCCRTTDDGSTYCITSLPRQSTDDENIATHNTANATLWHTIRSGVMFGVACVASPCCTPLIVPIILALLTGTPAAVWFTQHLGWVYGGLTLLSAVSLGLGLNWMRQKSESASRKAQPKPAIDTIAEMNVQPIARN